MNDTLELIDLEQLLNDECACESRHDDGRFQCSVTVTHRLYFTACKSPSKNVCLNVATAVLTGDGVCGYCLDKNDPDSSYKCWRIIPV